MVFPVDAGDLVMSVDGWRHSSAPIIIRIAVFFS
jgi:hypothetical protein